MSKKLKIHGLIEDRDVSEVTDMRDSLRNYGEFNEDISDRDAGVT